MKTPKNENYQYTRARPHHAEPRQNRRFRAAGLANRMSSHWQDVSAAGAPAHRRAQAPGAWRRGSAQRAARLPAPPAAPQATQTAAGRASALRSGGGDGFEHHQSISSCSCVPAEDRQSPGRTPAHQREHDPRRMSRASRGSQVACTMADEQTGELLRLKVPQGYVYAPLGRHATPVLPAITGDHVLVAATSRQRGSATTTSPTRSMNSMGYSPRARRRLCTGSCSGRVTAD
jgi:hypothetical protein